MTCSARSLALRLRAWASASSSAGVAPRGRVPLIGQVSIRSPWIAKKRSGEEDTIPPFGVVTREANGAGDSARSVR